MEAKTKVSFQQDKLDVVRYVVGNEPVLFKHWRTRYSALYLNEITITTRTPTAIF